MEHDSAEHESMEHDTEQPESGNNDADNDQMDDPDDNVEFEKVISFLVNAKLTAFT